VFACKPFEAGYDDDVPARSGRLVRQAIDVVVRRLSALPPSPSVEELLARAREHQRQVDTWAEALPAPAEREHLMKRVLALHLEVVTLERQAQ
jgi:hypothetical protein